MTNIKFWLQFYDLVCKISVNSTWDLYIKKFFAGTNVIILPKSPVGKLAKATLVIKSNSLERSPFFRLTRNGFDFILETGINSDFFLPFTPFIFQKIFATIAYSRDWIIIHASAFRYKNKAHLFVGHSGAGKTTIVELANKYYGLEILCDNQAFLYEKGNSFYLAPFPFDPFHNKNTKAVEGVAVNSLYFIHKAFQHKLTKLSFRDKVMYTQKFIQFHLPSIKSRNYEANYMRKLFKMIGHVRMYKLEFARKHGFLDLVSED